MRSSSSPRSTIARDSRRHPRKTTPRQAAVARELADELKKHQLQLAENDPHNPPASLAEFAVADLSPVPLALLSRRGVIISAGKPLFELLEAPAQDVLFHSIPEFLQPQDFPSFFKFLADCHNKRRTQRAEFLMAARDRFPRRVLLIVSPMEDAPIQRMVFRAAFVELTEGEQRSSDPRISQQDTRLMAAIDGIVWEADYPMRFTFVSQQAERILGFPAQRWLNNPDFWTRLIYHEDRERVVQARAHAIRKLSSHVLHYRMVTDDRRVIHVKDSAVIVAGAPGWTKMSGIITDVTDLEEAREDLKHANERLEAAVAERTAKMEQSLEAMETLCYGIAHDLKAPLRGLQGFIGILMSDYEQVFDKDAKLYAHRCQLAVQRMGELIEAVLAYGRLNHTLPELIPMNARAVIDRIVETLEAEITAKGAKVHVQMTFPRVVGNPFLLEQVFTNLISNALKFTKSGARPEISISATEIGPSDLRPPASDLRSPPSVVRITVTDNGIGITPEFTRRMFGMFQKLHRGEEYAGTGIGLAVVKRAVELMNGRVGLFSQPDQGSSFWIELPSA